MRLCLHQRFSRTALIQHKPPGLNYGRAPGFSALATNIYLSEVVYGYISPLGASVRSYQTSGAAAASATFREYITVTSASCTSFCSLTMKNGYTWYSFDRAGHRGRRMLGIRPLVSHDVLLAVRQFSGHERNDLPSPTWYHIRNITSFSLLGPIRLIPPFSKPNLPCIVIPFLPAGVVYANRSNVFLNGNTEVSGNYAVRSGGEPIRECADVAPMKVKRLRNNLQ